MLSLFHFLPFCSFAFWWCGLFLAKEAAIASREREIIKEADAQIKAVVCHVVVVYDMLIAHFFLILHSPLDVVVLGTLQLTALAPVGQANVQPVVDVVRKILNICAVFILNY